MNVLLRLFIVMLTISVAASLVSRPALSQPTPSVQVYPAPSNAPQSTQFTMLVQGQPSPVYETQNPTNPQPHQPPFEATTAWTSFAADTPVTVQVTNKTAFVSARILPSTNIVPTLTGNNGNGYTVASFTLGGGGPQQVSVEFCYTALASKQCTEQTQVLSDITNPLLVFANPLSANVPPQLPVPQVLTAPQDNNVPALGKDQTMIYFGPGFYDLGPTPYVLGQNQLSQNQVAFLAGGAYVKGMFAISDFTSIAGLGVLSGDVCAAGHGSACPMMIAAPAGRKTSGVTIRGITIVDAPYYNILLGGFGNTVSNIYSDVLLRDTKGNFQIWSFDGTSAPTLYDLPARDFNSNGVAFDTSWQVAAVGDVRGLGYASIVWTNQATCHVGITTFAFPEPFAAPPKVVNNTVLSGTMPAGSRIASTGDFNGDGTMDLLLLLPTGEQTIWYTGYFQGGAPYQPRPTTLPAQPGYNVQPSAPAQGLAPCCSGSGSC